MHVNLNPYLKAIVGVIGAIATGLQTAYPSSHWATTVTAGITAVLVYLVPNTPQGPPAPPDEPPVRM